MTKPSKFAQPFRGYEILERLGSGGMGTVFKARRRSDQELVALKVLRPSLSRNARYVERLRREAEISMRLDHPGLVKGYGLGEEGGYHYLVMEFVDGRSLKGLLKTWGRFPEEQVLDVGIQIAEALAYAHEHGVVHRDVKPGNILVDEDDHAKLADLGLAKGDTDPTLTRDGATVGTPQYMSPEQAREPGSVDARSDLYSLGATLYHMAVGLAPFEGESVVQVISKLLHDRADSAGSLNPAVSTGVNLILRRLLAKDPELRYTTAQELLADLRKVQQGHPPAVDVKVLARAEGGRRGRRRTHLAVAALAMVLAGFFGWRLLRQEPVRAPRHLRDLRASVADARKGFRYRLGMIDRFTPTEDERVGLGQLREAVLAEFRNAILAWQKDFAAAGTDHWIDEHGLSAQPATWGLEAQAALQVQPAFRGYTPGLLPAGIAKLYAAWVARREKLVEARLEDRLEAAAAAVRRHFEEVVVPALAAHRGRKEFREADDIVSRLLAAPWRCRPADGSPGPRLPATEASRLADIVRRLEDAKRGIRGEVLDLVAEWKTEIDNGIAHALEFAAQNLTAKAAAALARVRADLRAPPPWKSLPAGIEVRSGHLRARIDKVAGEIADANRRLDFRALEECEDAIQRVLARNLDVAEAQRILGNYRFVDPDVRARRDALGKDLDRLRDAVAWILDRLAAAGTRRWIVGETKIDGRVTGVVHEPIPAIILKISGKDRRFPLGAFDRVDLAQLVANGPGGSQHKIGLGLFLFFGDRFGEASLFLTNHRGARYRAMRSRREAYLAALGEKTETRAGRMLDKLRNLMNAPGPTLRHVDAAATLLDEVERDYGQTAAVRAARVDITRFHDRIELERERRALVLELGDDLRDAAELSLFHDGDADSVRLVLAFGTSGALRDDVSGWRRTPGGLAPPASDGARPEAELAVPLHLDLPIVDPTSAVMMTLRFRIPAQRSLDVLVATVFGGRFMLVQMPGRGGTVLTDAPADPRHGLTRALKLARQERAGWFLLEGGHYVLEIEVGVVQNLSRRCALRLNGARILPRRSALRVPRSRTGIELGVIGGFVLEELRIEGRVRR